jgi:arylsulfatase A-like enzyme/Tfp pilus assembly protein PilF
MKKSPNMRRVIHFLVLITIYVLCSFPFIEGNYALSADKKDLNLLIITVDTLRADHVGIYGYKKINTPNIDNLGEKGVIFTQAFCHVPLTLPSHCSLFTGTLPVFHGVRDNGYRLPSFNITLAEIIKRKGYQTAAFVGAFPLDSRFGLNKGFDVYDDLYGSKNLIRDLSFIERRAEGVNKKAIEWITRNKNSRFFVWVHYFDPHTPYEPPPPFKHEYIGREYDGEIAYTDHSIGKLLDKLNELKLVEKTLIVLTSDHGEGLGDHNEMTHGIFIYDSTLRVPLIFYNPALFPKSRIVSEQVGLIDVMPTILDLMGLPRSPKIQGKSFRPSLLKEKSNSNDYCYIESVAAMMDRNWAPLQGVRTGDWKYIDAPLPELYDLKSDPKEKKNIIEKNTKIAQHLRRKLLRVIKNNSSPLSSHVFKAEIEEETKEKLKSLGYITGRTIGGDIERPDPKIMIEVDNIFNEAIIASETGNLKMAGKLYDKVLQKQPNFIIGYEYAAYNYYKMGKIDKAISLLQKALDLKLINNSLLARLGLYYQETGKLIKSKEILENLVQEDKNYAEAHNYLGVTYYKSGQLKKAVNSFKNALTLDNDYAMAMNNLGNCYLALKKYDLAEKEYKKALSVDDQLASAHNGLGVCYYRQDLVKEALFNWEKSLELNPQQTDTLYNIGRVHLRLGHKQKALHFFELFIQTASPQKYGKDIEEVKKVIERLKRELQIDPCK